MPRLIRYATRRVITRVLPLPAAATISSGPSTCVAASRCGGGQVLQQLVSFQQRSLLLPPIVYQLTMHETIRPAAPHYISPFGRMKATPS